MNGASGFSGVFIDGVLEFGVIFWLPGHVETFLNILHVD
jgi:hypothetical protein